MKMQNQNKTNPFGPEKFKNKYRVKSARMEDHDYSSDGSYFITICADERKSHFGSIKDNKMNLSELENIAEKFWKEIPNHFPFIVLDAFIVMPNHVHGILIIDKEYFLDGHIKPKYLWDEEIACGENAMRRDEITCRDAKFCVSTNEKPNKFGPQSQNLASVIRGFKAAVKKYATMNDISFQWQSRFYDEIIKSAESYGNIRAYILNNAVNWKNDCYFVI